MSDRHTEKARKRVLAKDRVEQKILMSSTPVSTDQIEMLTGYHTLTVKIALRDLLESGRIREVGTFGNRKLWSWGSPSEGDRVRAPSSSKMSGEYKPEPWSHTVARPGSTQHEDIPSRRNDTRFFRDGRQEKP